MKKMVILALASMMLFMSTANAYYMNNYAKWRKMNETQQAAYVMGVFDVVTQGMTGDNSGERDFKNGIAECVDDLKLTNNMLRDIVVDYYKVNTKEWGFPTYFVINNVLADLCSSYVGEDQKINYADD